MNRLAITIIFLTTFTICSSAQIKSGVAIVGGGSFSKTINDQIDSKFIPGINAGLSFHNEISDNLLYEIGIVYAQRGQKYDLPGTSVNEVYNYISMPLAVKTYISKFSISAGFYVSLFRSGTIEIDGNKADIENNFNLGDGGFLGGVGFGVTDDLEVNLRYNHGFQEVYDQGGNNQSITLGINYLIFPY